jgi:hypothetical protein
VQQFEHRLENESSEQLFRADSSENTHECHGR